jgi:alpha-1,2-mannosyltransferase
MSAASALRVGLCALIGSARGLAGLRPAVKIVTIGLLGVAPLGLLALFLAAATTMRTAGGWPHAIDFHTLWVGAGEYAHGRDPYPASLHEFVGDGPRQSFVYPPAAAALLAPLAVLPYTAAVSVFVTISVIAIGASLWLLDVRDWRCYGAAFVCPGVFSSISIGTMSPLLLLAAAAVWRFRDSLSRCVIVLAVAVAAKLFLWPLFLWLWFTGRRRAALVAGFTTCAVSLAAWMPLGFAGFATYPTLLRRVSDVEGPRGYGIAAIVPGHSTLVAVALLIGVGLFVVVVSKRRTHLLDTHVYTAAVAASFVLSPIVWLHYFTIIFVVIAVTHPKFGAVWLAPGGLWLTVHEGAYGDAWRLGVFAAIACAVFALSLIGRPARRVPRDGVVVETSETAALPRQSSRFQHMPARSTRPNGGVCD